MSGHEAATGPVTARIARDRAACTPADLDAVRFEVARVDVLAPGGPGALRPHGVA
jgi:hypothetical protein